MEVSRRLRISADTVRTWRRRFLERAWTACALGGDAATGGTLAFPHKAKADFTYGGSSSEICEELYSDSVKKARRPPPRQGPCQGHGHELTCVHVTLLPPTLAGRGQQGVMGLRGPSPGQWLAVAALRIQLRNSIARCSQWPSIKESGAADG
ncbi:hypothetical protein [Streptomyces sp. NPDC059402]|uniref:hypothetical protein n=1 Tax=Streptomyces sp. NPDC059402 TaxID=3346822 RepID=UPI0036945102